MYQIGENQLGKLKLWGNQVSPFLDFALANAKFPTKTEG